MNKNLFIYSFKYLAVLLALVTFSSCERDEFTQADALNLENARLDEQFRRDTAYVNATTDAAIRNAAARAKIEELTRRGMGGTAYYTVSIVPGGSTAFSSGRFEEAQTIGDVAAEVTVSQFNNGNFPNPDGSANTANGLTQTVSASSGVASFALYGGEATVQITFPNGEFTPVSYVVSLTPDGGVSNGAAVHVGNVIPVFEVPGGGADTDETKATISGLAFAETEIQYGNNDEEAVPEGTPVVAYIDVTPAFMSKYINTGFGEEMGNIDGTTTMSGYVQRVAYGQASTRTTVGAAIPTGDNNNPNNPDDSQGQGAPYTLQVAATASGLPIMLKYGEFAANRTYFADNEEDGDTGLIRKRFLYTQSTELGSTPQLAPTPINLVGNMDITYTAFDFNESPATGTVTYTSTPSTSLSAASVSAANQINLFGKTASVTVSAPDAGGTNATAAIVFDEVDFQGEDNGTFILDALTITSGGSGYSSNGTVTVTPLSYTGRDAAGVPVPNGNGIVQNVAAGIGYIEVINSGFGYTGVGGATTFSGAGNSTGVNPTALVNNVGDPIGQTPTGGSPAFVDVVVDRASGTVAQVDVASGGDGYTDPEVTIVNGSDLTLGDNTEATPTVDGNNAIVFFETNGSGGLRFVTGNTTFGDGDGDLTNGLEENPNVTGLRLQQSPVPYALVPNVSVNGTAATINFDGAGTPAAGFELPTIGARVNDLGQITELFITNPGTGFGNVADVALSGITLNVTAILPRAEAQAFNSTGGSIGNYIVNTSLPIDQSIYKTEAEAAYAADSNNGGSGAGEFNYLTASLVGGALLVTAENNGDTFVAGQYGNINNGEVHSDYKVVFAAPVNGGTAAWGYPLFEEDGSELVGVLLTSQGSGYLDGENPSFWVIPADVSWSEYATIRTFTATRGAATESFVFTLDAGSGSSYAVRPEVSVSGGTEFSAQELVTLRQGLTSAIRGSLQFNETGSITGVGATANASTLSLSLGLVPSGTTSGTSFTVTLSTDRLEGLYNAEVNGGGSTAFTGYLGYAEGSLTPVYYTDNTGLPTTTAYNFFKSVEGAVDGVSGTSALLLGGTTGASGDSYITAPTFTVMGNGGAVANGSAVLDNGGDITALTMTVTNPDGFFTGTNDPSYSAAGERFRTIGGPSKFDVFSGISYVRDVNYGTGIELE